MKGITMTMSAQILRTEASLIEQEAVTARLKSLGGPWTSTPAYTRFSRVELATKLRHVRDSVLSETNADRSDVEDAYDQSQAFVSSAFDVYHGHRGLGDKIARAFVVPMRSDRIDDSYASESLPFYPLLDPVRFGVTSEIRMRTMYGIPPTILDTYLKSDDPNETGALVLCPLYSDMSNDIWHTPSDIEQAMCLTKTVDDILEATARFIHVKLGADYVGLGATLPHPTLTNFGRKLRAIDGMEGLTTTTGHGGTVWTLVQTLIAALAETSTPSSGQIGVLGGAGSIGWSTIQAIHKLVPGFRMHTFDKREDRLHSLLSDRPDLEGVTTAGSVAEVLRNSKIIVSAITERIDLDDAPYADIDLTGTLFIDDSQPGAVDRHQLEARGGKVVWVAAQDGSKSRFMTKDGLYTNGVGYDYGAASGLHGAATEFACGSEVAVVAASRDRSAAVSGPVTFQDVERIGRLFNEYGVELAPFQSFGQPVRMD